MYTRNFFPEQSTDINIPENYDGVALRESDDDFSEKEIHNKEGVTTSTSAKTQCGNEESGFVGWLKKLPFKIPYLEEKVASNGFFSNFGTEELLIIGIALFLIFSSAHDIECGVMILLLLFIK